jgi:hypothetical protein
MRLALHEVALWVSVVKPVALIPLDELVPCQTTTGDNLKLQCDAESVSILCDLTQELTTNALSSMLPRHTDSVDLIPMLIDLSQVRDGTELLDHVAYGIDGLDLCRYIPGHGLILT